MSENAEEIRFVYISPKGKVVVKDTNQRGFMRYVIVKDSPEYGNYVELRQIFISPKNRQKGYGKKFIRFLVGLGHKENLTAIYVATSVREDEVFGKFLIATGFKRIGSRNITEMPHFPFKKTIRQYAKRK